MGGLLIGAPVLGICAVIWIVVWVASPSKADAVFEFGFGVCKVFIDLMEA